MGQVLAVAKLEVRAGKAHITATSEAADGWKMITMNGAGRAMPQSGWLKVKVEIADTEYRCGALLVKSRPGLFNEISALVSGLNSLEKDHENSSSSK